MMTGWMAVVWMATAAVLFLFLCPTVRADVVPGEVIDKGNSEKVEGLVPDFVLAWVKSGDLTMKIGELKFDPTRFWSREILDNWESNAGRYLVDDNNGIIDKTTGKPARGIKGFPFPKVDPNDPKMPLMLMWNRQFVEYFLQGNIRERQYWLSVTRGGLEKTYIMENLSMVLDPAKSEQDYAQISVFREPFNMAGTGSLAIYPLCPLQQGIRYAYATELRRVKRLSHRLSGSDVMFGLDQAPDDSWAGGPKTNMEEGTYRFLGEREALVPYTAETPLYVEFNDKGSIDMSPARTGLMYRPGFETEGWTGAPWHLTNIIWVKTRVYVIESRSRDPNYGYGPCEGWIEKGTFVGAYKRITDPNGKLWKGVYWPNHAAGTRDGRFGLIDSFAAVVVDLRRDHGSCFPYPYYRGGSKEIMIQDMNANLFTSAGFVQFTK